MSENWVTEHGSYEIQVSVAIERGPFKEEEGSAQKGKSRKAG